MPPADRPKAGSSTANLVVSLDEFASLCGVTPETMRSHLRGAPPDADWLLQRGRRGVGYQIAAEGALAWWRNRDRGEQQDDVRNQKLAELRLRMLGGDAIEEDLVLTGKQRREEFQAGEAELAYREAMGELARASDFDAELATAVIELRRKLQGIGRAVRRRFALEREVEDAIDEQIAEHLKAFVATLDVDDSNNGDGFRARPRLVGAAGLCGSGASPVQAKSSRSFLPKSAALLLRARA